MNRYFDLQVNGAFGVDFNSDDLEVTQLEAVCSRFQAMGVTRFLPTIITAKLADMVSRIDRLAEYCRSSSIVAKCVAGIHVEGPFLSREPGYIGAHPVAHVLSATRRDAESLLTAGQGRIRLVTLAPEQDPGGEVTQWLTEQGVRVSAGHTDANIAQLRCALDHGLSAFTHLGNGTPLLMHRHDNIIQRVLALREEMWIMMIADGHHVPLPFFSNLLAMFDLNRVILVSDAIFAAGLGKGAYAWQGKEIEVTEERACWDASRQHFVGSVTTLPEMDAWLAESLGMTEAVRQRLLGDNARQFIGESH